MDSRRTFTDIDFSFIPHPVTKDIGILSGVDAVKQAIRNLVLTQHYERAFHPEIGCHTTALLFENILPTTQIMIQKSVESVVRNFEPRAELIAVIVTVEPDENGYMVRIEYSLANQPDPVIMDLFLERLR